MLGSAPFACLVVLGVVTSGCVVFPEIAEQPEEVRVVGILADKLDPSALQPAVLDRAKPLATFDVSTAVIPYNIDGPVYYSWYYDYDNTNNIPLPFYSLCGDSPRCYFWVCAKPRSTEDVHRLLLVVSDSKLKEDPTGPLDFPDGAVFDTAQWQLSLKGACP